MSPELNPPPETLYHIDDLNETFNNKLPYILRNAPYRIDVEGYRPFARAGIETPQTPQRAKRLWNEAFGHRIVAGYPIPDFTGMDFSVGFDPDHDEATEYDSFDINWSDGTQLKYQDTQIGICLFPLKGDELFGEPCKMEWDEFMTIIKECGLPPALRIERRPMDKITYLMQELRDTEKIVIKRKRRIAINPATTMDVEFAATYADTEGSDEKGLVEEMALNLYRSQEPGTSPHFLNSSVFKIDSHGQGSFYASYDCPLTAGQLLDEHVIAEHRLKTPSINLLEQMRQALQELD